MKTNKSRLLISVGALALLGALALEGCSSDDSSVGGAGAGGKGGTSAGGKGGTSAGGKGGMSAGGTGAAGKGGTGTGGTGAAGKGGTGAGGKGGTSAGGKGGTGTGPGGAGGDMGLGGMAGDMGAAGAPPIAEHPSTDECTAFCAMEATVCTAANAAYASTPECMTDCAAFALGVDTDPTHMTAESGDNFACRAYHLYNASLMPAGVSNAPVHCPHTANVSHNMDGSTATAPCKPM